MYFVIFLGATCPISVHFYIDKPLLMVLSKHSQAVGMETISRFFPLIETDKEISFPDQIDI